MSNSPLANSPAITTLSTDFVDELLAGNDRWNIAAASGVAAGYGLLMFVALFNFIREKHRSHLLLVLFGAFRVVAFSVRAYMQKHLSQNLAIVYEVFFAVGFVALVKLLISLLMAWTLPDARQLAGSSHGSRRSMMPSLLRSHGSFQERFFLLALIVGAVCSIIGATDAYNSSATVREYNKGLALMKAGYTIYLVVIVVFCFLCLIQPFTSFTADRQSGARQGAARKFLMMFILLVCGLLLTCKSVFQVIAIYTNPALTFHNKLFYPLEVAPEMLVFLILVIPGLIHMYLRDYSADSALNSKANPTYSESKAPANLAPVEAETTV